MMRKIGMLLMVVICLVVGLVGCNGKRVDISTLNSSDVVEFMDDDYKKVYSDEQAKIIAETVSTILEIVQRINIESKYSEIDIALSKHAREMVAKCLDISENTDITTKDGSVVNNSKYVYDGVNIVAEAWLNIEPLKGNKDNVQNSLNNILNLIQDKYDNVVDQYLVLDMERYEDYKVYIINNTVK